SASELTPRTRILQRREKAHVDKNLLGLKIKVLDGLLRSRFKRTTVKNALFPRNMRFFAPHKETGQFGN
ncbi:MAG TPA: hypothetical protein VNZ25_07410, partial [Candidatus Angelobacter sp.]|nr:hypothetical protein [Candidatus Angelobacter sp.]